MNTQTENSAAAEAEQQRQQAIQELVVDEGAGWSDRYKPGTFGCHELLDRTSNSASLIETQLLQHPACIQNPEWYALAEQAVTALNDLYQSIGAVHMTATNEGN